MAEVKIEIEGMSCQHCVMAVKKAVTQLNGVTGADVEIGSADVKFDDTKVRREDIEAAITKAGYKVVKP
ncbi:MAG: copper ion binding protein [Nitrospiraceae bacterium]|nr:copper ion binding protein [Nitrospiraceae bacterium]